MEKLSLGELKGRVRALLPADELVPADDMEAALDRLPSVVGGVTDDDLEAALAAADPKNELIDLLVWGRTFAVGEAQEAVGAASPQDGRLGAGHGDDGRRSQVYLPLKGQGGGYVKRKRKSKSRRSTRRKSTRRRSTRRKSHRRKSYRRKSYRRRSTRRRSYRRKHTRRKSTRRKSKRSRR